MKPSSMTSPALVLTPRRLQRPLPVRPNGIRSCDVSGAFLAVGTRPAPALGLVPSGTVEQSTHTSGRASNHSTGCQRNTRCSIAPRTNVNSLLPNCACPAPCTISSLCISSYAPSIRPPPSCPTAEYPPFLRHSQRIDATAFLYFQFLLNFWGVFCCDSLVQSF